ncbi:hypothetical protein ACRJ4W_07265 [Streptomyces sp. GLT-R25]
MVGPGGFEPLIREHQDANGKRTISSITYRRRTDGENLEDLLDPGRLGEYTNAFTAALGKALESRGNDAGPEVETVTPGLETSLSLGTSSTTSPSVPSTFRPVSSGT